MSGCLPSLGRCAPGPVPTERTSLLEGDPGQGPGCAACSLKSPVDSGEARRRKTSIRLQWEGQEPPSFRVYPGVESVPRTLTTGVSGVAKRLPGGALCLCFGCLAPAAFCPLSWKVALLTRGKVRTHPRSRRGDRALRQCPASQVPAGAPAGSRSGWHTSAAGLPSAESSAKVTTWGSALRGSLQGRREKWDIEPYVQT